MFETSSARRSGDLCHKEVRRPVLLRLLGWFLVATGSCEFWLFGGAVLVLVLGGLLLGDGRQPRLQHIRQPAFFSGCDRTQQMRRDQNQQFLGGFIGGAAAE